MSDPPFDQTSLPAYMQQSVLGYYDKSEFRLGLLELLCFTGALAWLFLKSARYLALRRGKPTCLHPATAAFALVLYFASVTLPPYDVNTTHWFPFIAGVTGIRNGVWPYLNGFDSSYGVLAPAFLALWTSWFGLSALSLSALIMASNLVCGAASFTLIRRLTGSRAVALLGGAILVLNATDTLAVTSTFRAPLQTTLGALLLYDSLRRRGRRLLSGFLFGVVVLWNPPFGAFAAAGFVFAHAFAAFYAKHEERREHLGSMLAMLTAIGLSMSAIWVAHTGTAVSLPEIYAGSTAASNLALLGYRNMQQQFNRLAIPAFMLVVLYLSLTFHRLQRSRRMTSRGLFIGASIITAVPYVLYATGRSDATHHFAAYWALIPSIALLFYGFVRLPSLRLYPAAGNPYWLRRSIRSSASFLAVLYLVAFPYDRLTNAVANQAVGYEPAREKWYRACAAGKRCDSELKPSLQNYLKQARQPLPEAESIGNDPGLVAACKQGIPIVSYRDALVYAAANCYAPLGIPTINAINTRHDFERYMALLGPQRFIVFDRNRNVYAMWRGDMLGEMKSRLNALGFDETPGCGSISIFSKEDPSKLLRSLCD